MAQLEANLVCAQNIYQLTLPQLLHVDDCLERFQKWKRSCQVVVLRMHELKWASIVSRGSTQQDYCLGHSLPSREWTTCRFDVIPKPGVEIILLHRIRFERQMENSQTSSPDDFLLNFHK